MQTSLIGLRHLEQARIPISERLNSGGWIEGMTHSLGWAGAQYSQSPMDADGGAVMWNSLPRPCPDMLVNTDHFPEKIGINEKAAPAWAGQ
jgi:hypothetical protein